MKLHVIILAAGKGTRMKSALPKVLAPLAAKPLLSHVIQTAQQLDAASINVVIGHGAEQVRSMFTNQNINWYTQTEQNGTGHAVKQGIPNIPDDESVLVLYGDVPMIKVQTLDTLITGLQQHSLAVLTANLDDPTGYGRILRNNDGYLCGIIEQKDATEKEQTIKEINTGILAGNAGKLKKWLYLLNTHNTQGEEYLTDVVSIADQEGEKIFSSQPDSNNEINGINSKIELAAAERRFQQIQAQDCLEKGLTIIDPARFDLRGTLKFGQDCTIDINTIINGNVSLGDNVTIHANCVLSNCHIENNTVIHPNTVLENCHIGANANVGPFARIRPGTTLADNTRIGNFVELKNTTLSTGSKVNHLSYVGDSQVGENSNIGAGVITCNYDGANKHQTIIGDNTFIGSNAQLVAPVQVENGATIAAGSTITQKVPENSLAVARSKQRNIAGWKRPKKNN